MARATQTEATARRKIDRAYKAIRAAEKAAAEAAEWLEVRGVKAPLNSLFAISRPMWKTAEKLAEARDLIRDFASNEVVSPWKAKKAEAAQDDA